MRLSNRDIGPLDHNAIHAVALSLLGLIVVGWGAVQTRHTNGGEKRPVVNAAAMQPSLLKIRINEADVSELGLLPSIGPKMARRIVAYRRQHGAFTSWFDVEQISGMGPATIATIAPFCEIDALHPPTHTLAGEF